MQSPLGGCPISTPSLSVFNALHCMLVSAPCYGQHAPHKVSNTFCHKYGTDRVPCFHACDIKILLIKWIWLLCSQKSLGTPVGQLSFAFQGCCDIEQRLHVISELQHSCAELVSWAKTCSTEPTNGTPHQRYHLLCKPKLERIRSGAA